MQHDVSTEGSKMNDTIINNKGDTIPAIEVDKMLDLIKSEMAGQFNGQMIADYTTSAVEKSSSSYRFRITFWYVIKNVKWVYRATVVNSVGIYSFSTLPSLVDKSPAEA